MVEQVTPECCRHCRKAKAHLSEARVGPDFSDVIEPWLGRLRFIGLSKTLRSSARKACPPESIRQQPLKCHALKEPGPWRDHNSRAGILTLTAGPLSSASSQRQPFRINLLVRVVHPGTRGLSYRRASWLACRIRSQSAIKLPCLNPESLRATVEMHGGAALPSFMCIGAYSIRSASFSGSITPFCSLLRSNPFSVSARSITDTLPARSARLAIAFHAVKSWLRSAVKLISTTF